ncbi:MAG: hypothetical protein KVP17_004316 [Porospora cf. gigantea B]|uniref:uncharacterized protein n=1 Tax=Porospora cf. gigantea B TaxID=2853592 RepID=UPI003571CA86|nr:MAG: hypothetical protein KVP17_004316 [Porospora cf. gigantea B]
MWSILLTLSVATLIDDLFDRSPLRQLQADNRQGFDDLPVIVKRSVYHSLTDEGLERQNSLPVTRTVYCNAAIAGAAAMRQASLPIAFRSELKEVTVDLIDGKSIVNESVVDDPVDYMLFKQFKDEIRLYAREELSPQRIMNERLHPDLIPIRGGNVSVTLLDWKDVALAKGRLSTDMIAKAERRQGSSRRSNASYARRLSRLHPDISQFYLTKADSEAPSLEGSAEAFLDAEARWGNHDGMNTNMNRKLTEYYKQWKELQQPHAAEAESPRGLQSVALTRRTFKRIELTPESGQSGPRCRLLAQLPLSDDDEMEMLPPDPAPIKLRLSTSSDDTAEEVFTGYYHVRPARKFFQFELMPSWARIPGLNGQNFLKNNDLNVTYHVSLRPEGAAKDLYDLAPSGDRDWNAPPLFNKIFLREDGYRSKEWPDGEDPFGPDIGIRCGRWGISE